VVILFLGLAVTDVEELVALATVVLIGLLATLGADPGLLTQ
jgi:hypothetical protein